MAPQARAILSRVDMSKQRSLKDLFNKSKDILDGSECDDLSDKEDDLETDLFDDDSVTDSVQNRDSLASEEQDEAIAGTCTRETESEIINKPNQPRRQKFPLKLFGKQQRCFNSKWFDNDKWSSWLHWDDQLQKVLC